MSKTQNNPLPRIAAALACTLAVAGPAGMPALDPSIPGVAVIRVVPGVPVGTALLDLVDALPAGVDVTFSLLDVSLADRQIYLLNYEPAAAESDVGIMLHTPPASLVWGELLYAAHDPEGHTGSIWFHSVGGIVQYQTQYAATMLGLPPAQQRTSGSGVIVAVLDTGIDASHPLLGGSVIPGGFNFIDGSSNTDDVGDGVDNDMPPDGLIDESVGHGTFVAGLIHLVAPEADLLPIVVLDSDGLGDAWALALGLFYAINQGADVINLSLGSTYDSAAVEAALEEAKDLGIVVVAAGGNQNVGEAFEEFPAAKRSNAMGVAALDDQDAKASFSNFNKSFSISAPGTSIPDAGGPDGFDPVRTIYSALPGDQLGIWEGTSFATAFVSGAAALVRAQHPDWPNAVMFGEEIVNEIEWVLGETSAEIYDPVRNPANQPYALDQELGVGRLDADAATLVALGDIDADGSIGITDLLALLNAWGPCCEPCGEEEDDPACRADLDADRFVGITDFLTMLSNWG